MAGFRPDGYIDLARDSGVLHVTNGLLLEVARHDLAGALVHYEKALRWLSAWDPLHGDAPGRPT